jgi:hypothetical protein
MYQTQTYKAIVVLTNMYQKLVPVITHMAKHIIYFHCIKADVLIAFLGYSCYIYQYHNIQLLKLHTMDNIQIKKLNMLLSDKDPETVQQNLHNNVSNTHNGKVNFTMSLVRLLFTMWCKTRNRQEKYFFIYIWQVLSCNKDKNYRLISHTI